MRDGRVLIFHERPLLPIPNVDKIMVCNNIKGRFTLFLEKKKQKNDNNGSIQLTYLKKFLCRLTPYSFSRLYFHAHWFKEFQRLSKITAELNKKETGPKNAVK